jgi:hypothetical protein
MEQIDLPLLLCLFDPSLLRRVEGVAAANLGVFNIAKISFLSCATHL